MHNPENTSEFQLRQDSRRRRLLIVSTSPFLYGLSERGAGAKRRPPKVVPMFDTTKLETTASEPIVTPKPPPPDVQLPEVVPIIEDEEFEASPPITP